MIRTQAYKDFGNVSAGRLFVNKELLPRIIAKLPDIGSVLFVGEHRYWCYQSFFNNPAKLMDFKSIDIHPGSGKIGDENYYPTPDYNMSIETCDGIPDDSFDCIVMIGVYEYLDHKKEAFAQIYRMLKPGGIAVMSIVGEGYDPAPNNHIKPENVWNDLLPLRVDEVYTTYEQKDKPPTAVHVVAKKVLSGV